MIKSLIRTWSHILLVAGVAFYPSDPAAAQQEAPSFRLRDRGPGVASSMWATFVEQRQLLVFPFFAYTQDHNHEYQPAEFGLGPNEDFTGRLRMTESQLFVAYGISDQLAVEAEAAYLSARLNKAPNDTTLTPKRIEESGFGDFEAQVRFRLSAERAHVPEIFGFVEVTAPSNRGRGLIGDEDWDARPGIGVIRGFSWGTLLSRIAIEYNREGSHLDLGEFAITFLRRLNASMRFNLTFEGGESGAADEWELISGIQWRAGRVVVIRFDNTIGLSPKAPDWVPQVGVMLTVPN